MKKRTLSILQLLATALIIIILTGCAAPQYQTYISDYQSYYDHKAPSIYPPTTNALLHFHYSGINKDNLPALLDDYLLIGEAGFTGGSSAGGNAMPYAKSIGADILVTTKKHLGQETKQVPTTVQTRSSGGFFADSSFGSWTPVTTYGTETVMKDVTLDRYEYWGLFFKNVNNVHPLWEQTEIEYLKTASNKHEGIWKNQNYRLNVFQSGKQLVGFVISTQNQNWKPSDLKLVCGTSLGKGIYLMGDKAPMPVNIGTNKFGHLEIEELIGNGDVFSFEKELLPY